MKPGTSLYETRGGHPLQLWGWGSVKAAHGWRVTRLVVEEEGSIIGLAQVLVRSLPRPFTSLAYIARGPIATNGKGEAVRAALVLHVKSTFRSVVLTAEPDSSDDIQWAGWRKSSNRILLARTAVLDLDKDEDELLAAMSKKTRQYIRKSAGEAVEVVKATDLEEVDACLAIYKQTAQRAGFALHDDSYYHDIFANLGEAAPLYLAKSRGEVVAFLWPIVTPEVAFELYGGMNDNGQQLRANYHLKWTVIQTMKGQGIRRYDVNGLLNDGVSNFKKGFIPDETMMAGTFDKPLSPLYPIWSILLPTAKRIIQRFRRA